jgi:diguanylate cyclase (GGDEF)-like protein/PAS domain S-box-containing protein
MSFKVLILENDATARAWFAAALRSRGHEVLVPTDAREAWRACLAERPSLVILDWTGDAGRELCERIRASEAGRRCVVLATGLSDRPRDLEATLESGANDYLTKYTDIGGLEARLAVAERRVREIQEQSRAEEALRSSEERWTLASQGANDGLWDWNLKTGEACYSPRWTAMLGDEEVVLRGSCQDWLCRIHPEDVSRVRAKLAAYLKGRTSRFEDEHRMLHRDGSYRLVLCRGSAVRDARGRARRMAGAQMDVTEHRNCDALTGLANRTLFKERLGQAFARSRREAGAAFALLFVDLDDFKAVNEELGHLAGDRLLTAVARRLEVCLRPGDLVGRLGGDEFGVLLEPIKDLADATQVAARIQSELLATRNAGTAVVPSASIGIALSATSHERVEDLLRDADAAMRRAKAAGKARYEVFDVGMRDRLRDERELESALQRALQGNELFLLYEPIVSLENGQASGFEALLRWRHPRRGLLPAPEFVPVAERTGLMVPISEWMLREACAQLKRWQRLSGGGGLQLAIDVPGRQLAARGFVEKLELLLRETGVSARSLRLEVTEAVLLARPPNLGATLEALHRLGVRLCIDDFGSGYSRLADLRQLPVQTLKVHPSFVTPLGDGGDTGVVRAVLSLAHSLGLDAAAAGVESEAQAASLRALGCVEGQGPCFSGPLTPEGVESWLGASQPRRARALVDLTAPRRGTGAVMDATGLTA